MLASGAEVTVQVAGLDYGSGDLPTRVQNQLDSTTLVPENEVLEPYNPGITAGAIFGTIMTGSNVGSPYVLAVTVQTTVDFGSSVDVLTMIVAAVTAVCGTAPATSSITAAPDESNPAVQNASQGVVPSVTNYASGLVTNVGNLLNNVVGIGNSAATAAQWLPWVLVGGVILVIVVLSSGRKSNLTSLIPKLT